MVKDEDAWNFCYMFPEATEETLADIYSMIYMVGSLHMDGWSHLLYFVPQKLRRYVIQELIDKNI